MPAVDDLNALMSNLPGYALLSDSMKQAALDGALIPDAQGVWPGQPDYVPTHDMYYAAIRLTGFLMAQPVVRSSSSEGTSVSVDAPDWQGLLAWYRSMSHIAAVNGNDVLRIVPVPGGSHVTKTDMSGRGTHYGDVDTDLN